MTSHGLPRKVFDLHSVKLIARPENRPGPKRKGSSSNHPFSGALAVSFRDGSEENQSPLFSSQRIYPAW